MTETWLKKKIKDEERVGEEEVSCSVDVIPEERRVRITRFVVNLNLRKIQLEYTRGAQTDICFEEQIIQW